MKRPQGNLQVSTGLGITGLYNQLLIVFKDVQLSEFLPHLKGMGVDDLLVVIFPMILWVWAIIHNEDNPEPVQEIEIVNQADPNQLDELLKKENPIEL